VLLADLVDASRAMASDPSRRGKKKVMAELLRHVPPSEIAIAVSYLSGALRQRRTGVGWASLRSRPPGAAEASLNLFEVDEAFARAASLSGGGSAAERRGVMEGLFSRATQEEQDFLVRLVSGELRQGALAALVAEALALATDTDVGLVRRASMLAGGLGPVAEALLIEGQQGLDRYRLQVGSPVQPMLAQAAGSLEEAMARLPATAVEWKLDGIRIQVHRAGSEVSVFSRSLDRLTHRVPEIVNAVLSLPNEAVILDGEAIRLGDADRPLPFQETGRRVATREDVPALTSTAPLSAFFFDVLHLDGEDLIDRPAEERFRILEAALPERFLVPRLIRPSAESAAEFSRDALARGHEGVIVKDLAAPYEAGRRGGAWLKVKPHHTLDLVVLAAEWGHGRRQGWLSNLHLGARNAETGEFVMLGKTFKGLTDEMLTRQTSALLALRESDNGWLVRVRPELVVEVAFDGVQRSPRYPGGVALRFARVVRYRDDKRSWEADTIDTVRRIFSSGR